MKNNCCKKDIANLKIQTGYGQKIYSESKFYVKSELEKYTNEHKGGFFYGGNIKSNQSLFEEVVKEAEKNRLIA